MQVPLEMKEPAGQFRGCAEVCDSSRRRARIVVCALCIVVVFGSCVAHTIWSSMVSVGDGGRT